MTEVLADYGDAVLHRFGWFVKSRTLQVARCGFRGEDRPIMIHLERQAPEGAALCPWCMEDDAMPRVLWAGVVRHARPHPGHISNEPLRRAFACSGLAASELAMRIGWVRPDGHGDGTRLARVLGINPARRNLAGERVRQASMTERNALAIAAALGFDPVDVGL